MGLVLLIAAVVVLVSLSYQIDLTIINRDYEEWKRNRR
jgi:hypothetical protein